MTDDAAYRIEEAHLAAAREAVRAHALLTPLVPAPALGPRVWLKLETEQLTGSFKLRGALARLSALSEEERKRPVIAASAGNHGLGVAEAARRLELAARIYLPRGAPYVKREGIAARGAEVVVTDAPGYDAAEVIARAAAKADGGTFVSAFDDPYVAAGNGGTVAEELFEGLGAAVLDAIVTPVGGGGLLAGLAAARDRAGRANVRLVGVQSEACPAMTRSLAENRVIETLGADGPTLAEGLEGGVTKTTVALVRASGARVLTVTEDAIADAMRFAWSRLGLRLEGSSATVIAWARAHLAIEPGAGAVVLVVTGRNVDDVVFRRVVAG